MDGLPEDHIARCWWEGRLPALSSDGDWPQLPTAGNFDAKRNAVGREIHHGPLLVNRLKAQYAEAQLAHPIRLRDLSDPQSRTVTTGHQLCLAGGPAFTFYKIQTAITLAQRLQERWKTPVVPVFWLASEDHDFDEVRSLWNGAQWQTWHPEPQEGGAVGRMSTRGLAGELQTWASALELSGSGADGLKFPEDSTMSQAMRHWVHAMFGLEHVVVIDGDDAGLKATFIETMQREVRESLTDQAVSSCNSVLEAAGFKPQVHVRPCNLFHLVPGGRHRLTSSGQMWQSLGGAKWEGAEALCQNIAAHPEEFSPNALLRPVYQAQLLPDVAMVGGLAEVAYGMQLPGVFARLGMEQPVLVPRDSAVVLSKRWSNATTKAGITDAALLESKATWIQGIVNQAEAPDAADWRLSVQEQAAKASEALVHVDRSLEGSVNATLAKMENLLDRLEQQTVKAIKRKEAEAMSRLDRLDGWVRPNGKPQERTCSFFHLASEWQQQAEEGETLDKVLAQASLRGHEAADWSPLVHVIRSGPH